MINEASYKDVSKCHTIQNPAELWGWTQKRVFSGVLPPAPTWMEKGWRRVDEFLRNVGCPPHSKNMQNTRVAGVRSLQRGCPSSPHLRSVLGAGAGGWRTLTYTLTGSLRSCPHSSGQSQPMVKPDIAGQRAFLSPVTGSGAGRGMWGTTFHMNGIIVITTITLCHEYLPLPVATLSLLAV